MGLVGHDARPTVDARRCALHASGVRALHSLAGMRRAVPHGPVGPQPVPPWRQGGALSTLWVYAPCTPWRECGELFHMGLVGPQPVPPWMQGGALSTLRVYAPWAPRGGLGERVHMGLVGPGPVPPWTQGEALPFGLCQGSVPGVRSDSGKGSAPCATAPRSLRGQTPRYGTRHDTRVSVGGRGVPETPSGAINRAATAALAGVSIEEAGGRSPARKLAFS